MTLTTDQLTAIDRHLRKENWLLNEDLIAELADHYANGIEERMANGIPFDLALLDIHKGFGGRKGLLKMEEDYQIGQKQGNVRLFWSILIQYLKFPRLHITIIVTLIFYYLNSTNTNLLKSNYQIVALLIAMFFSYIFAFVRLMHPFKLGISRSYIISLALQSFNGVLLAGFYLRFFLPVTTVQELHPFIATLICIAIFLCEASVIELFIKHARKRIKTV